MQILWMKQAGTGWLAGGQHLAMQHALENSGCSVRVQQHSGRTIWRRPRCDWLIWSFVPTAMDVWSAKLIAQRQMCVIHELAGHGKFLPSVDHWCAASESLCAAIKACGIPGERVSVWQGSVNSQTHDARGIDRDGTVIHVAGGLEASSGCLLAVWALRMVQYLHPKIRMVLHNAGPMAERIRAFAESTCEADTVIFAENQSVHELVSQADAVWIPRMEDGVPDALFFALRAGKPILASNQPSLREWLRNEENALVLPMGNAPVWAKAMNRLMTEFGLEERLGHGARQTAIRGEQMELPECLKVVDGGDRTVQAA